MELARMTGKGQLTLPVSIRKKLGISTGDQLLFYERDGQVIIAPVTPSSLAEAYHKRAELYSQTASKAEQIALCQFIRDGHLGAQTRKLRRLYSQKLKELTKAIKSVFGASAKIKAGSAGTSLAVTLPFHGSREQLKKQAQAKSLHLQFLEITEESITLLFSCSAMPAKDFETACRLSLIHI